MAGEPVERGEGLPGEPGRVIYSRSPDGEGREVIQARISLPARDLIDRRAAEETRGVRSEWIRRALKYSANHMPPGWNR